ncbi:MAG TPA: RNB domain-containing ribonuclease [Nocardioidaceae bacterium]|nr:RNB domain-containing ribonuclease [Nocardioidaceae bacterium]
MPKRVVRLNDEAWEADGASLAVAVATVQQEMGVTAKFPSAVERAAAAVTPRLPSLDRTDLEFVTIDPASAMDLDQALHLERAGDGYVVHYAIADVAAFVTPGDPIDVESHTRGETLYGADSKIPLHPKAVSEDAASLLADVDRPALLWTIELDSEGAQTSVRVERAMVRSRAKLSYVAVQQSIDDGTVSPMLALLKEIGELRLEQEKARGGVSLPLPSQEIDVDAQGHWSLSYRNQLPVELWNAQISLLTGMAAASLMLEHKVGLLRTLPPADPRDLARLRRTAKALRVPWPDGLSYPDFIRSLDPESAAGAAVLVASTRTLRGAAYVGFDGSLPEQTQHAAIASTYAHVTAPLRRLVDRYAGEICLALCAGEPVPEWVRSQLATLPDVMRDSSRRAGQYERSLLDLLEAAVLQEHVGEVFYGVVVSVDERDPREGRVTMRNPAIEAECVAPDPLPLGEDVKVRLTQADVRARLVMFELA